MSLDLLSFVASLIGVFLSFMLAALALELGMLFLPPHQHRIRALLKMVPFMTLIFDFFCFDLKIGHFFNPLCCNSCLQKLFLQWLPQLKNHLTENNISLLEYFAVGNEPHLAFALKALLYSISTLLLLRKCYLAFLGWLALHAINQKASACRRAIEDPFLKQTLHKHRAKIYVSEDICIPIATYKGQILLPWQIAQEIEQQGFEAIVAHELEHIRWKDPLAKFVLEMTAAFFWYVPTYFWLRKLEQEQEIACDKSILRYGLAPESFAAAFVQVVKAAKSAEKSLAWLHLVTKASFSMVRLHLMLGMQKSRQSTLSVPALIGAVVAVGISLVCLSV